MPWRSTPAAQHRVRNSCTSYFLGWLLPSLSSGIRLSTFADEQMQALTDLPYEFRPSRHRSRRDYARRFRRSMPHPITPIEISPANEGSGTTFNTLLMIIVSLGFTVRSHS